MYEEVKVVRSYKEEISYVNALAKADMDSVQDMVFLEDSLAFIKFC